MAQEKIAKINIPEIVTEEFRVPTDTLGIELYVRNKYLRIKKKLDGSKVLLFVHGATYPSEAVFDLRLGDFSMMEYLVDAGYDVYLMDIRGYGLSSRPKEMSEPSDMNAPIVGTDTAVKDVSTVVDFILKHRQVPKINLMGWSWGTVIVGSYTAENNGKVNKLILYAPMWLRKSPPAADTGGKLGAYRNVDINLEKERWLKGVPEKKKLDLIPKGWYEKWAEGVSKKTLIAPNGVLQDGRDYWSAGKPFYDPSKILSPTLLIHAEWDQDLPSNMLYACFEKLTNTSYKRFVEIGEGTHMVILEKNRMQLFSEVKMFLNENFEPEK